MQVENLMTKTVITIQPHKNVYEAAKKMKKHNIGCLVVMERDRLMGIMTERDLLNKVTASNKVPSRVKVSSIMTSRVITSKKNTTLFAISSLMSTNNIRRVVITNDNNDKVVGIITLQDLILGPLKQESAKI